MKEKITAFINNLIFYDYVLFASAFSLFILILILALILRRKTIVSAFLALVSFSILFLAPTLGYIKMHEYLFPNEIKLLSQKRLHFTPAIVLRGEVTNKSKRFFKQCKITASVLRQSKNRLKTFLYQFKPIKKMSMLEVDVAQNKTRSFKMIIEPFTSSHDYNISLKADCR